MRCEPVGAALVGGGDGQAQRTGDGVEVAAQRERGRRGHHGAVVVEERAQRAGDRQRSHHDAPPPVVAFDPDHVEGGAGQHPLRGLVHVREYGLGLLFADRIGIVRLDLTDVFEGRAGCPVEQRDRLGEKLRQAGGEPPGWRLGQPECQRVARLHQPLVRVDLHKGACPSGRPVHQVGGELRLTRRADPLGQFVRLVDDQQPVRRDDVPAGEHVEGEQAVIGDHDVDLTGAGPGCLREALLTERTPRRADTLARGHRHLPPRGLVHAGVELVAVTGHGLGGPLAQPLHLTPEPAGLTEPHGGGGTAVGLEQAVRLLGRAAIQFGQAQVMMAALEHGERRLAAQLWLHRLGQPGQVVVHQLMLQREGGRGDHHRSGDQQRRHQVGERLSGARAGLDQQMFALAGGLADRGGHGLLPVPGDAAGHRADGRLEQVGDGGGSTCAGHGE